MKKYIAFHWLVPKNELPKNARHLRKGTIWIRRDVWKNKVKRKRILGHEKFEISLMKRGIPYKKAHRITNAMHHRKE